MIQKAAHIMNGGCPHQYIPESNTTPRNSHPKPETGGPNQETPSQNKNV